MKSKKGFTNIIAGVLFFGIIALLFLFFTVGIKQIFSENILDPTATSLKDAGTTAGALPAATTQIDDLETSYNSDWFSFDLFFLVFLVAYIIISIGMARKASKLGIFIHGWNGPSNKKSQRSNLLTK